MDSPLEQSTRIGCTLWDNPYDIDNYDHDQEAFEFNGQIKGLALLSHAPNNGNESYAGGGAGCISIPATGWDTKHNFTVLDGRMTMSLPRPTDFSCDSVSLENNKNLQSYPNNLSDQELCSYSHAPLLPIIQMMKENFPDNFEISDSPDPSSCNYRI